MKYFQSKFVFNVFSDFSVHELLCSTTVSHLSFCGTFYVTEAVVLIPQPSRQTYCCDPFFCVEFIHPFICIFLQSVPQVQFVRLFSFLLRRELDFVSLLLKIFSQLFTDLLRWWVMTRPVKMSQFNGNFLASL